VGFLRPQGAKTVVRDNLSGAEVLELCRIRPGLLCQADQAFGTLQAAVMVGGDICDELGGMAHPYCFSADFDIHLCLQKFLISN
jgi:hypothetical protein